MKRFNQINNLIGTPTSATGASRRLPVVEPQSARA
jgi:hypothetical protein